MYSMGALGEKDNNKQTKTQRSKLKNNTQRMLLLLVLLLLQLLLQQQQRGSIDVFACIEAETSSNRQP